MQLSISRNIEIGEKSSIFIQNIIIIQDQRVLIQDQRVLPLYEFLSHTEQLVGKFRRFFPRYDDAFEYFLRIVPGFKANFPRFQEIFPRKTSRGSSTCVCNLYSEIRISQEKCVWSKISIVRLDFKSHGPFVSLVSVIVRSHEAKNIITGFIAYAFRI